MLKYVEIYSTYEFICSIYGTPNNWATDTPFCPNKSPNIHQLSKYLLQSQQSPPQKNSHTSAYPSIILYQRVAFGMNPPVLYGQESDEISETTKKSPGQSHKPQAISMAVFLSDKSYPPQVGVVYIPPEKKTPREFHGSTPKPPFERAYVDSQG